MALALPRDQPAAKAQWMPTPSQVHRLFADLPHSLLLTPNRTVLAWFSPASLSRRPDKQIRQARGLRTAAGGGGRGWGAWVRPGGRGVSDKGALCCANFFQDVKGVTIDNPDCWGGCQGQGGVGGPWPRISSAFQQARMESLTSPPLPPHPTSAWGPPPRRPPTLEVDQTGPRELQGTERGSERGGAVGRHMGEIWLRDRQL